MPQIPVQGPDSPGTEFRFYNDGSKLVITDNGSRVDYYEQSTHSYSTYDRNGNLTNLGVGETHPH